MLTQPQTGTRDLNITHNKIICVEGFLAKIDNYSPRINYVSFDSEAFAMFFFRRHAATFTGCYFEVFPSIPSNEFELLCFHKHINVVIIMSFAHSACHILKLIRMHAKTSI